MFTEMREYIRDDGAREAFDLLLTVENFETVPRWAARQGTGYGQKKSVTFRQPNNGSRMYSFTVNRSWLLFYIRNPGWCDEWNEQLPALAERFKADQSQNPGGEWRARVRNVDEVLFIVELSKQTPRPIRLASGRRRQDR